MAILSSALGVMSDAFSLGFLHQVMGLLKKVGFWHEDSAFAWKHLCCISCVSLVFLCSVDSLTMLGFL